MLSPAKNSMSRRKIESRFGNKSILDLHNTKRRINAALFCVQEALIITIFSVEFFVTHYQIQNEFNHRNDSGNGGPKEG